MAAPDSITMLDLTSTMVMNKTLSDSTDEILRLQGVSWITRRLISFATITLYTKHYKSEDDGVEHVDIDQVGTGGLGSTENRTLDWKETETDNSIFGWTISKSRRVTLGDIEHPWQKEDWLELDNGLIQSVAVSDTPKSGTTWEASQIWGFAMVNDERRHVRRVHFTGPNGEIIEARLVYDWKE